MHIEAGDAGDVWVATMAKTARGKCGIPTPLWCIEARQGHVHLAVQRLVGMRCVALAMRTLARMEAGLWHGILPGKQFSVSQVIVAALAAL